MSLTDEDKAWMTEQFGALRISLRTELVQRIEKAETGLRAELAERVDGLRTELAERIEKTETTLLTEFHRWASPAELRQRSHAAAMRAFDAELEAVSDRVTRIEKREPPAA